MRYLSTRTAAARLVLCATLAWLGLASVAVAQVTFNVEGRGEGSIRIDLNLDDSSGGDRGELITLARFVQRDLHSSGFFSIAVLPPGARSAQGNWQTPEASAYTARLSSVAAGPSGRVVSVEVDEAGTAKTLLRRQFQVSENDPPLIGHTVSDIIYEYFVGREGFFATKIAYVQQVQNRNRTQFQIVSSYVDGSDQQVLSVSNEDLSSPRLSADGNTLLYVRISEDRPQLFFTEFSTNRSGPVFRDREVRFGPDIAADGTIYYTKVINGNADIYSSRIGTSAEKRLTFSQSIETASSVSPDGKRIAYITDAQGPLRITVLDLASGSTRNIGTSGYYGSPSWSPDGKMLAFTRQSGGTFSIGVVALDTLEERLISTSYFEEHPVWAKNSRVLLFERGGRDGSGSSLWQVDLDSARLYKLPLTAQASDPMWFQR